MRFKQYQTGWAWEARCGNCGQSSKAEFATKVLAEDNARQEIQGFDAIAASKEYFRRLRKRGTECQLTADDHRAIRKAGANKKMSRPAKSGERQP
jgi:hypothetical protein